MTIKKNALCAMVIIVALLAAGILFLKYAIDKHEKSYDYDAVIAKIDITEDLRRADSSFAACNARVLQGDTTAYGELHQQVATMNDVTLLHYSLVMVDKYHYYPACVHVSRAFQYPHSSIDSVSGINRKRMSYYLHLGAEHGDTACIAELKRLNL